MPEYRPHRPGPFEVEWLMSGDICDRSLVLRAQSGEINAFDALVRKYRHRVMKLVMRYTRNCADAEDAVQETFIKAYFALPHFRGDSAFYSWLHRIAINSASTLLAARARQSRVFANVHWTIGEAEETSAMTKDLDTPEELALTEEVCDAVNAAITALSVDQQTAIVLRELEGLSYSQVAEAMFCPIGTVRSRVYRARKAIDYQLRHIFDDGLGRSRRVAPAMRRLMSEVSCPV
jgi:RNA polymerase sigma-70 factor (ECF subfamily)